MMSLSDKKEIWRGMPQETPEQQLWADNYYDAELIPMAQERFRGHYASEKGDYYGLFLLMGPLWELSTFSVALFEPQNVHIFCRKEQALQVKLLQQNLRLDDGSLCCTYIQGEDIPSLYRVMKKQHDIWDSVGRTAIDITGGSALAAPAAAMAAACLDIDVYRIESQYLPAYHHHDPGTECLCRIPAVTSVIGVD